MEKSTAAAKRSFHPYIHHPAGPLQQINQNVLRNIVRPEEDLVKQDNNEITEVTPTQLSENNETDTEEVQQQSQPPLPAEQKDELAKEAIEQAKTESEPSTSAAETEAVTDSESLMQADAAIDSKGFIEKKQSLKKADQKQKMQGKKQNIDGSSGEEAEVETKSPTSPEDDPAFQAVKNKARREARKQKKHDPAATKASAAQAAAKGPPKEVEDSAKGKQLGKMQQQKTKAFDKKSFKAALLKRIYEITPKNLKQADNFKDSGKAKALKSDVVGNVQKSKQASQGDIEKTTAETPDQTGIKAKEIKALPPTEVGAPPRGLKASRAAPKQKTVSEVSLQQGSQSLDQEMIDADVTEEQLNNSNEPEFISALDSKKQAQQDAVDSPVAFREEEQTILGGAKSQARGSAGFYGKAMHTQRDLMLGKVVKKQDTTKTEDEKKRTEISGNIQKIYNKTKLAVENRLKKLDTRVNNIFDKGAEKVRIRFEDYVADRMRKYKKKRYSGLKGKVLWGKDLFFDLPSYVNSFYVKGRDLYIKAMTLVIDKVALAVEAGLNDAKTTITKGRKSVTDYVDSLPKDLQKIGKGAAEKIGADFDSLEQKVDDKQTQLIDSLARKYVDNLNKIDQRIKKMKEANKGLVSKAKDAVVGVINTVRKLKNMLLNVLARVANVIGSIIKAPIRFLGNLVKGVGLGLRNFMGNILTHLKKGLIGWLFGALEGAKIKLPTTFDLKGIISIILQVLGLTYANFRLRAVRILGEPFVKRLEQVAEIFKIVATEGAVGLWKWIKDKLTAIKETVWDGIMSFVKERIIVAGITWLIGLLNPAAAFIKACKMIYDIVMFFVNRGKQILALVNAVLNSVAAIVKGSVTVAATAVENALSKALPVAISFLASLLGLGGISQKIRGIINRVQRPVNKAMDFVIKKAAKAVGALVSKGKGVAGKVVVWWRQRKKFKAGGKDHEIYIQGSEVKPIVMISSSPGVPWSTYLKNLKPTAKQKNDHTKAVELAKKVESPKPRNKNEDVHAKDKVKWFNALAVIMKKLTGSKKKPASVIKYGGITSDGGGKKAVASILSEDHPVGTKPTDKPVIWKNLGSLVSNPPYYVQGHLLNEKLGGPGRSFNMTPITTKANANHKTKVENPVKNWVNVNKKVAFYSVQAIYPSSKARRSSRHVDLEKADKQGSISNREKKELISEKERFATRKLVKEILCRAYSLDHDSSSQKWKQSKTKSLDINEPIPNE